jgi:hypothetical protein
MFSWFPRSIFSRGSDELCEVVRGLVSGSRRPLLNAFNSDAMCPGNEGFPCLY